MPVEVRWTVNSSVSCFHALETLASGETVVDLRVAELLTQPTHDLIAACSAVGVSPGRLFMHLTPLAAGIDDTRSLVELVLRKLGCHDHSPANGSRLVAVLAETKHAYTRLLPDLLDELELRSGPLREQWEARGSGLLAGVELRTEPELLPEQADVLLVTPARGGGGTAYLAYNSASIEAVLANPHSDLPETVRLGWVLSQLNSDVPRHAENLAPGSMQLVIALAMIPPVIDSAENVELVPDAARAIGRALEVWQPAGEQSVKLAQPLAAWWKTYQENRPRWAVALLALEQMVGQVLGDVSNDMEKSGAG
jgi:hypothetical protein